MVRQPRSNSIAGTDNSARYGAFASIALSRLDAAYRDVEVSACLVHPPR